MIAGLIKDDFILLMERKLFRKMMRISNIINNEILQGWTKGERVLKTVKKLCVRVMDKLGLNPNNDWVDIDNTKSNTYVLE